MPRPRVFISYNSKDRALARPVVEALKARGIEPWIDQEQLPPGRPWLPLLEQGLTDCTAVLVLLGPNGIGPVQQEEVSAALSQTRWLAASGDERRRLTACATECPRPADTSTVA